MPRTALVRRTQSDRIDYAFQTATQRSVTYKIAVPLPVPTTLLWTVTVCDAHTGKELYIERDADAIKTMPGRGWFSYVSRPALDTPRLTDSPS
ncbi:MAG TPA: hypothetical protein VFD67_12100 [Gemmatimonadaceae bacterium]|nr:hypothetical protein [Gemmatimonadaceae bacterium]